MSSKRFYIDLFAGCGGLSLGLYNSRRWQGFAAIEKNPLAFATLSHNLIKRKRHFDWPSWFPREAADIRSSLKKYQGEFEKLQGKIELIAGGPPCQGFSVAGKRMSGDARNHLVKDYLKFVATVKPKLVFFENVRGFTMPFIAGEKSPSNFVVNRLKKLGYSVAYRVVDFSDFGVPQRRERFILVGRLNGDAEKFFELLEKQKSKFLKSKGLPQNPTAIDAIGDLERKHGEVLNSEYPKFKFGKFGKPTGSYQEYMRNSVSIESIPDSHRFANHTQGKESLMRSLLDTSRKGRKLTNETRQAYKMKKHSVTILDPQDKAPTLTTLPDDCLHYSEPRILTVREYARLQSFPDWFEFKGKYTTGGVLRKKETPRYTQVGNAIPPLFAELAGRVLSEIME